MTPDKRVEEMSHKFRQLCAGDVCAGGLPDFDKAFRTVVTQDRAALHTSLVAAVEGLKYQQPHVDTPFHTEDKIYAMNATLDQVLTIINSIFKE